MFAGIASALTLLFLKMKSFAKTFLRQLSSEYIDRGAGFDISDDAVYNQLPSGDGYSGAIPETCTITFEISRSDEL
jgi:hypothetical protein